MPNTPINREERAMQVMREALKEAGFTDAPEPTRHNISEIFEYLKGGDK